jgi:hypothetical protein
LRIDVETAAFGFAPETQWRICENVDQARRDVLMAETPFEAIVAGLASGVSAISARREVHSKNKNYSRRRITIFTDDAFVDLWHNGRGGYRAQYLLSAGQGERANTYAVEALHAAVVPFFDARRRLNGRDIKDLQSPSAKIWIKEGLWWRHANWVTQIDVPVWNVTPKPTDAKLQRKAHAGRLLPNGDPRLVLKPIWRPDNSGQQQPSTVGKPPEVRTEQIRIYGYT